MAETPERQAQDECDAACRRLEAELNAIVARYPGARWLTDNGQPIEVIVIADGR